MSQVHVALFKWKDGVSEGEVEEALDKVRSVATRVAGIRNIWCGRNSSKYAQGYTHAVVVIGDDEKALSAYRADSIHMAAAAAIDSFELDGIGVDFNDSP